MIDEVCKSGGESLFGSYSCHRMINKMMLLRQTLGTAACRVKLLMSESLELEAVSVTVRPESDCFSQLSAKVTPLFSYTVAAGAKETQS